jgi:hypothetical protein
MRNKKVFIFITFVIIAVCGVILALLPSNRGVTQERFELLKPGMTRAEVDHLLYGPPRNDLRYPAIIWLPQATGERISAEMAPGSPVVDFFSHEEKPKNGRQGVWITSADDFFPQVMPKDGRQGVWVTRTGLIAVHFGRDGRLKHKYISTVHEPGRPSVFDWLASRPRMIRRSLGL